MEISKKLKRIISLVLVWVMFTTCIPDSFISVVRAYAEDSTGGSQETDRKTITLNFTLQNENSSTDAEKTTTTEEETTTAEEGTTAEEETTTGTDDVQMLNGDGEKIIFTLYQITEQGLEKKISATYPDSVESGNLEQNEENITAKIEKGNEENKYKVTLENINPNENYIYTLQNQEDTDSMPILLASKALETTESSYDVSVIIYENTDIITVKGWIKQEFSDDAIDVTYTIYPIIKKQNTDGTESEIILTEDEAKLAEGSISVSKNIEETENLSATVEKRDGVIGYAVKFKGNNKTELVETSSDDNVKYVIGSKDEPKKLVDKVELTEDSIEIQISKADDTTKEAYEPSYNDKIKMKASLNDSVSSLTEEEKNEVNGKLKVRLEYKVDGNGWTEVNIDSEDQTYTIYEMTQYRVMVSLKDSEYAKISSEIEIKTFTPKTLTGSSVEFTDKVKNVENQYITDLKAKAEEQEIDLKSYIKQDSSVGIKAELIELSDKISITDGKLKIPAYYIGKVGVKYTVTQTGYKDATADLYINIAYAELDDTMLSESIDTKTVYSNKEGHRAIIQATDGYDLYVLKYSDGSAPELSSSTDEKVNDGDGKITLSENTSRSENYRIYATDRNKIIYSKDVVINTDTVAPTVSIIPDKFEENNYQEKTVYVTISGEDNFDSEGCLKAIVASITVNDGKNDLSKAAENDIKFNENKYTYQIGDNSYYTITFSQNEYKYTILFSGSAKYEIKDFSYTDKVGNSSSSLSLNKFIVDEIAPTASGFEWMAYNLTDNTDTGSNTFSTSIENRKSVYAAYLEDLTKKTSFSLTGVEDNLSGIDNVYYFLSTEIVTDGFDSIEWKAGSIDNNGTVKIELDNNNKLDDGIYYIYYKLADKAGNVSYYNGVGMKLVMDNTAPKVAFTFEAKNENGLNVSETTNYTSVNIRFTLTEKDSYDENAFKSAVQKVFENCENVTIGEVDANLDGRYSISVALTNDGTYNLQTFKYADKSGNECVVADGSGELKLSFTIDNVAPTVNPTLLVKKYGESEYKKEENSGTVNYSATVQIEATDAVSGINTIYYYESDDEITDLKTITGWKEYSAELEITTEGKHYIYYKVIDNAGNVTLGSVVDFETDITSPEISMKIDSNLSGFWNTDTSVYTTGANEVPVEVTISDSNLNSKKISVKKDGSELTDDEISKIITWNGNKATINLKATENETHKYTITANAEDKAGNLNSLTKTVIIDKTAPTLTAAFKGTEKPGAAKDEKYYKEATLTITASDADSFNWNKFQEAVNKALGTFMAEDKAGNKVENAITVDYYEKKHQIVIEFKGEANYELTDIIYKDDCENSTTVTLKSPFTIDNTSPTAGAFIVNTFKNGDTDITESEITDWKSSSVLENRMVNNLYYSYTNQDGKYAYYKLKDISDNLSGMQKVEYVLTDKVCTDETDIAALTGWNKKDVIDNSIIVNVEKEGINYIYYRLTDNAGNVRYYNGVGIVIDVTAPVISYTYVDNSNNKADTKVTGTNTFAENVSAKIAITDKTLDTTAITVQKDNGEEKIYNALEWTTEPENDTKTAVLKFADTKEGKRNKYTIKTTSTDKAGNKTEHKEDVVIDRKSPKITLTSDNNENKKADHYYNGERSIFVSIVEEDSLNKSAFRTKIMDGITVKDITDASMAAEKPEDTAITESVSVMDKEKNVIYKISAWNEEKQGYEVTFEADAIYTINIIYFDLCGNEANVQVNDDIASFVIDSKAPTVMVTYQNDNQVKEYYYNGSRDMTISVQSLSYTYAKRYGDDSEKEKPVSGISWTRTVTDIDNYQSPTKTNSTDITWNYDEKNNIFATETMKNDKDGIYEFTIEGKNKCESAISVTYQANKSDKPEAVNDGTSFVIDTQAPVMEVTYDDTNKVSDHYYKGNREATVTVKDISLLYANTVRNTGKEINVSGIIETVTATDIEGKEVTNPVQTGAWGLDTEKNVFSQKITFQADAIYTFGVSGTDICGNKSELKDEKSDIEYQAADGTSFVIDTQAPVIEVTYDDTNKVSDHYYKGNREATVSVKDISLLYANTVENTEKGIHVSGITETVTATDIEGKEVTNPVQTDAWELDTEKNVFSQKITFQADAIYTFGVSGTDICGNLLNADGTTYRKADGRSFVIDTQAPVIEVTYHDNDANKTADHYYKGDREATLTVKDLSFIYENTIQNVEVGAENTGLMQVGYSIIANDVKGETISDNASGWKQDSIWTYDAAEHQYTRDIIFTGDAIYTFSVNGTDICGNTSEYKDEKSDITYQAADGTSFVIDTQAPVVTVEYNDSSKLQDHYYSDTRTATISVKDLSYVYENWMEKQNDAAKSDVETVSKRMNITLTAKDAAGNDIDAVTQSGWSFTDGTYRYVITYGEAAGSKVDAIFTSAFSGNDIYNNDALISYKNSEGDVTDYESFVIDREAPVVTIAYNDSSKKQEHYYSDTRTASLTVYDLSYVYENELAKQADETKTDVDTVGNRMNIMLTAKDAAGNDIDAVTESGWSFANGTYRYVITYGEAGGNKVDAIFTSAFSGNDIYTRRASISYQDSKGIVVTDYESFVIDREAPVVTIEYDDSNKLQDHYYSDTRTAAITVKDISYVYENQQAEQSKVTESDVYTVRNRMNITLTAKNAAGNDITAVTESGWNFADGAYHYVITYGEAGGNKVDAIFTSTFSGTDIYGRRISISYQDSEEKNVEDSASFVIDRKAPVITVTYTDTGKSKDHFYNADRTAAITVDDLSYAYEDQRRTAKDVLTPQERINLEITARDSLLNALTGEKAQSESNWSFANGKYTRTITFANEAIYDFAISGSDIFAHTTLDEAVGYNTTADNHSFVVDKTGPQVSLAYSDSNRTYYKGSRQAVLTMTDLSMIYNDRILSGTSLYLNDAQTDGTKSDSVKTTIRLRNDDAASDLNNAGNAYYTDSAWSLSGNVYTRTILYTGEAHYTFAIAGTDRCGNTADIAYNGNMDAGEFWIDLTNPTAQISYDNNSQTREIGGRGYFRGLRTATIVITEGISTFDSSKVNISITAKDASGNPVEAHTTMSGWTTRQQRDTGSATTHTLTITYPGDANYDFGISYTDKAGNVMNTVDTGSSMSPYHFTVDTTSPSGSVTVSGLGTWNTLVSYRTFGLWSRTAVDIGAGYQDATSSVYSVEYYKTARTTAMTVSELNALGSSEWTAYSPFTIRPDDQFTIYLRIEDRSGNVTYVSSDGVILDITAPDVESIAPEITVTPVQQPVNGIYNTDVTVDIKVSDPITNGTYSGLKNVHYQVLNMGNVTQEGDLYNFSYTGGSPLQSQLVQQWTDQIIVDRNLNNSNDVQIVISAQDNSGNYASASNSVKIDVTQPQINITYDNNNGDTSFGEATYFKEDRTATIEITERNFNPDDVQITLTNADGAVPSITGWSSSTGSAANGDENVYTTTLTYSADGDYNFDITYADMAGNQNTATDYGSSLAPQVFTVDKTLPVINVSYDNNAATNGNYYSAARTATISITEHNFETGRFTITTTATDNGVSKTAPGISGWTSNGDIHTATVSFTDDAYYTIGMSYTDMAGNQAAAFTEQNFYVDKTMPYVTLQGIRNNSANNGETIGFILTCTDTNFDVFAPVLTVARLVDGQNKVETYSFDRTVSVANGIQYVIDNLPTDGIYSLVCTVYDKAGNAFNKIIYLDDNGQEVSEMNVTDASVSLLDFSVNRDGSAYKLDDATVAMLGSYYIREIGDNIVIYETNVDDLTEYVVELNGKVLEEGKDYTIEKSGGNGEWYVKKYIINKDLFEEEDEYKIVIHTKDSAENEAYSDIKGAELSFVVDKTAPEITVSGVENNGRYQVESQTVTVIPTDDGGKLETLDISVLDNNGNPVEGYPVAYKGSTLTDELDKNNGNITFAIPEGTGMSVVIHCSDVAGNEMKELKYTNIVVSTSGLTIFLANKPLFYGTVGGVVAVVGGGSAVIILRRRKLSAGTKTQDDK